MRRRRETMIRHSLVFIPILLASAAAFAIVNSPMETNKRSFSRLSMATSSRELKKGKAKKPSKVAQRLAKAAREAARQAELNNNQVNFLEKEVEDKDYEDLPSIANIMDAIDEELLHPRDGSSFRKSDSFRTLLEHNEEIKEYKDPKKIKETYHVAIVFAKPLLKDQITVEYSSRLISLARAIQDEAYRPALICFCGAKKSKDDSLVDATSAGIIFFRHLCAANQISLEGTEFCVAQHEGSDLSWSSSTLRPVVDGFKQRRYLENWLDTSSTYESATDEYGLTRQEPRKKVHIHWTLISTEYHLCSLNDIHLRSPRQSPLNTLLQDFDHTVKDFRGIVRTTWCFRCSAYPFISSENNLTAFLGQCYLMAQGLWPLLVNLRGVVKQAEFFQRDNYSALVANRSSLVALLEEMNEAFRHNKERTAALVLPPNLKAQLQKSLVTTKSSRIGRDSGFISKDVALESALLSLGRCSDLVRPAGTLSPKSVPREDWKDALINLDHFLDLMERACDPDFPLPASDWGKLPDEEESVSEVEF